METIKALFSQREQAIKTKDQALFESTQINNPILWGSAFAMYRFVKDITIELLAEADDEADFSKYVFVKEVCTFEDGKIYLRFAMYGMLHTIKGWKVISIASTPLPFDPPLKSEKAKKTKKSSRVQK